MLVSASKSSSGGWQVNAIKYTGKAACTPCAGGQQNSRTGHQDAVVACQCIKSGTVGMLPGKD
ncbi:MAG: hypothetical protein CTY34_12610 [Methylobacter sp.]|nr:MAG: hypothetical protein CTY34_12610 [Methylobacter sp.]PPD17579.1 MAG: hypothetical protein CTY24_14660 [Methylobacter sp.]